jgi:phosphinothricin acetyltransferase
MVDNAGDRAPALDLQVLELQTRVELAENHVAFAWMGFVKTAETVRPGYDWATPIILQRRV